MKESNVIQVLYHGRLVGRLALTEDRRCAFEYSDEWISDGFSISPFSLPLRKHVFVPEKTYFDGLFGVFADSLPDAWGHILLNRVLRRNGKMGKDLNQLERLSIVGTAGMGAITYRPAINMPEDNQEIDLDLLARQCKQILTTEYDENLDELYQLGGMSGGARPKIMTTVGSEEWIIKFPAHVDRADIGQMEYDYSVCAKKCGINMTETRLFKSKQCPGYFGIKRFDRLGSDGEKPELRKVHMCTAAALLEADFEQPCLDYLDLMKLTKIMTNHDKGNIENMFLRMCFNVFAHNRDDHAKNFTFLYDEKQNRWKLSPAYDLTYSTTYYGEHTTSVAGNGSNPGEKDLLTVGVESGMQKRRCVELMECVRTNIMQQLRKYVK